VPPPGRPRRSEIATAGELTIVLEAQDRASQQLREVGQEVARLSQSVATAGRGLGGGLAAGISATADAMRLLQAAGAAAARVVGAITDQLREGFGANADLERATVAFTRFTGSAEDAARVIGVLRREAAVSPFDDREIIRAGSALISSARGSTEALLELVRVSEQLAVLDPLQGLEGGVFALREALSGDFQSLIERFEIPRTLIQRLKEEGVPNLEIVKRALEFRGVDAGAIEAYGRSFEGLQSTVGAFGNELRQLATSGAFRLIEEALAHLVALIDRFGDELRVAAQAVGQIFATMAQRVAQSLAPLVSLLDTVFPGLGEAIRGEFSRPIEEAGAAAARAAPQLQALQQVTDLQRVTRQLAEVGVAAATLQLDAERVRRSYEDQLRPLERQRELLQANAQLLGVQNALATNRATAERARLQAEIATLQQAAGAATDPGAADLTPRQRAIALALQERQLRVQELDLTEQQRPALQSVDQQIASIRRAQADALAPLERSLDLRREEASLLQIQRERLQQAADDAQRAGDAFGTAWKAAAGPDDATQAQNKATIGARADELAKEWLDRFEAWVNENGGTAWTAIAKSLTQWTVETGLPLAVRVGAQLGAGIWAGMQAALTKLLTENPLLAGAVLGLARGASPAGAALPQIADTAAAGVQAVGERGVTIEFGSGSITVGGIEDPAFGDRLKSALTEFLTAFVNAAANVEPGARAPLAGAGRTP